MQFGGDTRVDVDLKKQEVIYIDGYYIPEHSYFENYKCIIGEWDGREDDWDIFYYFENEEDLNSFMLTENRTDTEFVITKVIREV